MDGRRENTWILSLYTMRNSTESLKLGGGNINSKIHFLENKILVSILSAYFGFIFTYTLKIIICFSLKASIFFTDLFFQSKHKKHDSPEKSLKEIPSLRYSPCPHTKQTNKQIHKQTKGVRGEAATGVGWIPNLDHCQLVPRSLRQSWAQLCGYF